MSEIGTIRAIETIETDETVGELKLQIKKLTRLLAVQEKKFARLGSVVESSGNLAAVLKAEQSKQENYLRMVMQNSPNTIILLDRELRLAYCSDAFLRLAGIRSADTVVGQFASEIFKIWIGAEFASRIMASISSACENDATVTTEERDCFGGSGGSGGTGGPGGSGEAGGDGSGAGDGGDGGGRSEYSTTYTVSVTALHSKSNAIDGIMLLMYDISQIRRSQWEAEQASRAKSVFLSSMSHEIRTPMNAIIGMTTIGKAASTVEKKDYALEKIEGASAHLLGVINDILDMSKIEANKLELSPDVFDFEKMLQKVVNVINFRMDEKQLEFVVNIDRRIPRLLVGDDQRLAQVITNLLSNAVKFTPQGGSIRLCARLLGEEGGACEIQIDVADTGIGISEEQQSRLFNSFVQAESSTSRRFGGTGLGLAISKRIVEMMDGRIWIESEAGRGSTFSFTVRAGRAAAAEPESEIRRRALRASANRKNVRVLLADDAPEVREYFSEIARGLGVQCDVAAGGAEAMELIRRRGAYSIYFIDWKMPGMDGIELSRRIARMGAAGGVRDEGAGGGAGASGAEASGEGGGEGASGAGANGMGGAEAADTEGIGVAGAESAGMGGAETGAAGTGLPKSAIVLISAAEWSSIEDEARRAGVNRFLPKPLFPSSIADCVSECLGIDGLLGAAGASGAAQGGGADDFGGQRVLLAEDVEINREIVQTLLEPTGLEIHCAENGAVALRMFRDAPDLYSMIFMDVQMPVMDGFEATRQIRALGALGVPQAKKIPIIAMTANVFRTDIEDCLAAGMNDHLGKPLNIEEMLAKLRQYLPAGRAARAGSTGEGARGIIA